MPEEYNMFPKFRENVEHLYTKDVGSYKRCTMDFNDVKEGEIEEYLTKLVSLGYIKASSVRYEKQNTYIIVDNAGKHLNLVFNIKR